MPGLPRLRQVGLGILAIVGVFAVLIGAGYGLAAIFGGPAPAPTESAVPAVPSPGVNPIVTENQRPGTTDWHIADVAASGGIEGYANRSSATRGDSVTLYVSTSAGHFTVQAYRMGYYGGLGGRLVWQSASTRGGLQAPASVQPGSSMVTAPWHPSLTLKVDAAWTPGDYLLKLVGDAGQQRYIPLTVVDNASSAALVILNAVTTWQAYNDWGGYNLYNGPDRAPASRSRVVSFDRPYSGDGSGDFLGDEFPLVYFAESYGLDVTYWSDVDLHEQGESLLQRHRGLITLGHDEYWTQAMRMAATDARNAGVNLAFLGAEAVYRQIRLGPSPLGADREVIDYKDASEDPVARTAPAQTTVNWREPPVSLPESALIGEEYECNPVKADGVVVDASSWLFANTGLKNGDVIANLVGRWYDRANPATPTPADLEVLAHSPANCPGVGETHADMTYYSTTSGAGVFASGTGNWVCNITGSCLGDTRSHPDARILQITQNLLFGFAQEPAGLSHRSTSNLAGLGIKPPR